MGTVHTRIRPLTVGSFFAAALLVACIGVGGGSERRDPRDANEQRLLTLVPRDVVASCAFEFPENPFIGGGPKVATAGHPLAVAGLLCTWEPPEGGAGSVPLTYLLFPSPEVMYEDYWGRWVFEGRLGTDCVSGRPSELLYLRGGEEAGHVFCTGNDFQPEITWTDDETLVLANALLVALPGIGARELYEWWLDRQPDDVALRIGAAATQCVGMDANIVGTPGDDVLRGTPGDDIIVGLDGDDTILGLAAKDRICGGPGDDVLKGGDGNDVLAGGPGDDEIVGGGQVFDLVSYLEAPGPVRVDLAAGTAAGEEKDTIEGVDDVQGSRFDDVLVGDDDMNTMVGEAGNDRLVGGGGSGWNFLYGGPGDDVLEGGESRDWLSGGAGDDRLSGEERNDSLRGDEGDDELDGGPDPDRLDGGDGTDTCIGGEVAKRCES